MRSRRNGAEEGNKWTGGERDHKKKRRPKSDKIKLIAKLRRKVIRREGLGQIIKVFLVTYEK